MRSPAGHPRHRVLPLHRVNFQAGAFIAPDFLVRPGIRPPVLRLMVAVQRKALVGLFSFRWSPARLLQDVVRGVSRGGSPGAAYESWTHGQGQCIHLYELQ